MTRVRASCSIVGDNFSPAKFAALSSVPLIDANEPGDIGSVGRYRGVPTPYGSASIEVSDRSEEWSRFDDLLTLLESCVDALHDAGATDLTLWCSVFHDEQCNFAFSQQDLQRLAALNLDLAISCYSDEIDPAPREDQTTK